jgi:hypothetical protein
VVEYYPIQLYLVCKESKKMGKLDRMTYEELQELKTDVEYRLKEFRPIRIKRKWKRCGKKTCFCASGPADGTWDNLHGPYLFAQFVDRETKKTRNVSLGKFYHPEAVGELAEQTLNFSTFFHLNPDQYSKLGADEQRRNAWTIYLTEADFELLHGIGREDDRLGRHDVFYGTEANYDAYRSAKTALNEAKAACNHLWAASYGLASPAGQRVLKELLRKSYYLKEI